jgi:DNA ligase (NAD+)
MSKERISELSKQINKHRNLYYNEEPEIDDADFDLLCDELRELDPENIALTAIGAPVNSEWEKAPHKIAMGSLDKVNTPEELKSWALKIFKSRNSIFLTEKLDGLSVAVEYKDGEFVAAISRGNGRIGEAIGRNVSKMGGVKKYIKGLTANLRGEIILTRTNHKKYFPEYANPRNAASGITKRLDGEGCEHLNVLFYQIVGDTKKLPCGDFRSEFQQFEFIESLGLTTPYYEAFAGGDSKNDIGELCDRVSQKWEEYQTTIRNKLDYDVDGLVVRMNDIEDQIAVGEHHLRPKGARAFKFRNQFATTTVREIVWDCGGSGRITPVCWFNKTNLQGSNIEKASVYNIAYINELGLGVGAEVLVCKAGEIIPRVEKVLKPGKTIATIPTKCPACNGNVEMEGENLVCLSTDTCPAQRLGRLQKWIAKLNILEWGEGILIKLIESGKVNTVPDLYKLSREDLMSMERMGARSAEKCFNHLWAASTIPLEVLLGSLSIPLVAVSTIEFVIASGYDTLDAILELNEEQLMGIKGLGPAKAASMYKGLKRNRKLINELLELGIAIKEKEIMKTSNGNGKLAGKSFVFTGEASIGRKELIAMVEANGGTSDSGIKKRTTYLVQADPSKLSSKTKKAQAQGTAIISEEEFFAMCK